MTVTPYASSLRSLALALAFIGTPQAAAAEQAVQSPDPDALVRRAMDAHGSAVLDHAVVEYELFGTRLRVMHDGGVFRYEHIHGPDDPEGPKREIFDNDGVTVEVDGVRRPAGDEERGGIMMNLNGGRYMTLLPHRLDDPQARTSYLGATTIEGEPYHEVEVTFDEEAGHGSDDHFVFWIHRDTHTIDYRAVDFTLPGSGRRIQQFNVAVSPRRISGVLFTDWKQYGPHPDVGRQIEEFDDAWQADKLQETAPFEPREIQIRLLGGSDGPLTSEAREDPGSGP